MIFHPRAALALAAALVALAGAGGRADDEPDGGAPSADIRTVSGKVSALEWKDGKITVQASDGPVSVVVDRNTTVYLENRLGSLRDVAVGLPVRVSFGPEHRAFWLEVRPRGVMTSPGAGGEPDAGPAPAADGGPPDLPAPPTRDGGAGEADAGAPPGPPSPPATPPGRPGATPPETPQPNPPPTPGPTGPSPIPGGPVRQ
jgi:hypothetical protein